MTRQHAWSGWRLLVTGCVVAFFLGGDFRVADGVEPAVLFRRDNLVAWCIVPFDSQKRAPQARAKMLKELGLTKLAYDYRAEHIPTFDDEITALKSQGISLFAWWFPGALNDEARLILDVLKRHNVQTQLWVTGNGGPIDDQNDRQARIDAEVKRLRPIVEAAAAQGCTVGLYNHGAWFGEPENQLAIIEALKAPNVGIVYNLHHGHGHLERLPNLIKQMRPHLLAFNINGMTPGGDQKGEKILPVGAGSADEAWLRALVDSGYDGPIGILNHTGHDAELRLRDNLDGLDYLLARAAGKAAEPPRWRTWNAPAVSQTTDSSKNETAVADATPQVNPAATVSSPSTAKELTDADRQFIAKMAAEAKSQGQAGLGLQVFASAKLACLSCHKIVDLGGSVGPALTEIGKQRTPEQVVESIWWPHREIRPEYRAWMAIDDQGRVYRGYRTAEDTKTITLKDPAAGTEHALVKEQLDELLEVGSLMPDNLMAQLNPEQQRHLVAFLLSLGQPGQGSPESLRLAILETQVHGPEPFPFVRDPLIPANWPSWQAAINRDRVYDFYAKEAEYFRTQHHRPRMVTEFPGLDGGTLGHWGNQNEATWADDRWNATDLGSLQAGVFRDGKLTVARGVCVRLGDQQELSACFNPETLTYDAVWKDGFVTMSSVRHGFMSGLQMQGTSLPVPAQTKPKEPFQYQGFYRDGQRVVFAYRIGDVDYLDAPWVRDGQFERVVAPVAEHPLRHVVQGGQKQWNWSSTVAGTRGDATPYAIDSIPLPFENPWKSLIFCGDHDFLPDGSALVCTIQGEVWRAMGIDDRLEKVTWTRFASGLHHALGLVVADGQIYVLGRDQITRLHDRNHDGEADFYECFSNAFKTSAAGHDFICGLQRDAEGYFYTASGNQGLVRIPPDGQKAEVIATGFRNPDGLGLASDGTLTVPCSEGDWTPSSMICAVRPGVINTDIPGPQPIGGFVPPFYGWGGPREGRAPDLPLVYIPRGIDNSSGGQVEVTSDRWGPLQGQLLHFSYGTGSHFVLLRDNVEGQQQGALVPLPGEFAAGAHRGRFNPHDGQLYVTGMGGWGTYTVADGSFQRVRYTGADVQLPVAFHAHQNGILIRFSGPIDAESVEKTTSHFAQCWNYRYSPGYGSAEFSRRHPGARGHDVLTISDVQVVEDGQSIFLTLPDLQPVNMLHLWLQPNPGVFREVFATIHRLDEPFRCEQTQPVVAKIVDPHPILADLARAVSREKNPWLKRNHQARPVVMEAGKNLTFATRSFTAKPGEALRLTLKNPDVVPHNWALLKPGSLPRVGELTNKLIGDPDAASRHYVPKTDDVLVYTDVVDPQDEFTIWFQAPQQPGRYPYLCTFPGHWMVMNGELIVEP